ncbi:defensin Ec-AMP-D1 [Brachypodium distachyon]|uniref:Knottins-like domain-containing protein n=1 Tax=Brachypodium distachyon TaxID=15368 RepID=A0A0Q3E274_BRADI|nr:defensin Ec-AMP-D1 [Brachypodium distachyon]KQJ81750.1 hypothetical protein BRADI_5g02845v3 [Brachypodium distachyon]|eukprot:XP_003581056.1 defensin Ec-AMP-D1 [Brachypodium distachyon]
MDPSRKFFPAVFVLLLLVVATEVAPTEAKRECEAASVRFKGLCMVQTNCANVCLTEGFTGGRCSSFVRKCMCTKPC